MKPVFLLLLLPFLFQCNRTTYTSSDFPSDFLAFGNGGGFTGEVTTFFVLPNGQVFSSSSLGTDTLTYTQLSKRAATELIDQFTGLGLDTLDFNHPGNIYSFIEKHSQDEIIKLSMGDQEMPPPPALKDYYKELTESVQAVAEEQENK